MPEILVTSDGSHTLFVPEINEHYHSVAGAVQESQFVYIGAGFDFVASDRIRIFEVGFGTGLNALLTFVRSARLMKKVHYTAIEINPLSEEIINKLNYTNFIPPEYIQAFRRIHDAGWNVDEKIGEHFLLHKIKGDLLRYIDNEKYDLIYFDAFGPDKQPEIWSEDIFGKISGMTVSGGVFVTYSAKGEVRRMLRSNGFEVSQLPGPPGKRQITRAVKK